MEVLIALPFVAFLGEKLSERTLKLVIKGISPYFGQVNQDLADAVESVVCAVPGFVISFYAGLDVFVAIGLPLAGTGGVILTAFIAGFGTNLVHDILGAIPSK